MASLLQPHAVIKGDSLSAGELLSSSHQIPDYQRDFVWRPRTVAQLWEDLFEHYDRFAQNEHLVKPAGYFLGAMVVIESGDGTGKLEVVDGQQRLTVLSTVAAILLEAVRRLPQSEPYRHGLETELVKSLAKFQGGEWLPNLRFSDAVVNEFFLISCISSHKRLTRRNYWNGKASPLLARKNATPALIKGALHTGYACLNKFLRQAAPGPVRRSRLISFVQLFLECVVLLRISAYSHASAYTIFESLNNRGIPLSQSDLIKSQLLKLQPTEQDRQEIVDAWLAAKEAAGQSEFIELPDLLHISYLSRHGKTKASELFKSVKDLLKEDPSRARTYSEELFNDSQALEYLTYAHPASWTNQTKEMLNDVQHILGAKLAYPMLIAAYREYSLKAKEFEDAVAAVMNFTFRFLKVLDGSVEQLATIAHQAADIINSGKGTKSLRAFLLDHAPDSLFIEELSSASFTNTKLAYFAVYYLEKARLKGAVPLPHGVEQHLEHILPKTPTKTEWSQAHANKQKDPALFKEYLWRLGNLLPLPATINKSIENRGITVKMGGGTPPTGYASASLISPKDISRFLENGEWTYRSIDERQFDLAQNFAVDAWRL